MSATSTTSTVGRPPARPVPAPAPERKRWWRDPWRKPRFLEVITWGYLAWSLVPVLIAVAISFSSGRSNTTFQSPATLQYWTGTGFEGDNGSLFRDPELRGAIRQTLLQSFLTIALAVPLGVSFAIGLDRWRGRPANATNIMMLASFVLPEIVIGVAALYVVLYLLKFIPLGTPAQVMALVTFQCSYPVIICRARLLSIGKEYEEAAMDLGASPGQSIRRVLLPLIAPAIMASFALVFADVVDDFVTVSALSAGVTSDTLAMKIYATSRSSPTPEVNAAATVMLLTTLLVVVGGLLVYRWINRGQIGGGATDFMQL